MKLTDELLDAANISGAWTKAQLAVLGITYPLKGGWRHRVIGMEISDEDYQKLCELALMRVRPKKKRPGIAEPTKDRPTLPQKPVITSAPLDGMTELVAWLTDKLEVERVARAKIEKQVSVLQFQLEALRREIREARKISTEHDSGNY